MPTVVASTVVALLPDERAHGAAQHLPSVAHTPHSRYLRRTERLLRTLRSRGLAARVTLFDPAAYRDYCAQEALDPRSPESSGRYALLAASVDSLAYTGQPIDRLVRALRERAWTNRPGASDPARAARQFGRAPGCLCREVGELKASGQGHASSAVRSVGHLLQTAGPGGHQLVCTVTLVGEERVGPLSAVLHATGDTRGRVLVHEQQALAAAALLAAAMATRSPGGVVLRTTRDDTQLVRGWQLVQGWPQPLTEGQVLAVYRDHPGGEQRDRPEDGVEYRAGFTIPRPH